MERSRSQQEDGWAAESHGQCSRATSQHHVHRLRNIPCVPQPLAGNVAPGADFQQRSLGGSTVSASVVPAIVSNAVLAAVVTDTAEGNAPVAQSDVQALVVRAQAGDRTAYASLYTLYERKIHTYLRYHLNGRADVAEDLAADVFLKAMEKILTYKFNGVPFSAWLYRIAHNHLIDYLRAQPRRQGTSLDECGAVDDPRAERALDDTLTQHELVAALDGLTAEQRQVVVLRFLHDK